MRVEYTLIPKQEATVSDTIVSPHVFKIDQAEVTIELIKNKIDKLKISFYNIGYDLSPLGKETKIILHEKELRYSAYKICSYIANRIYTESGTDAFECNELIDNDAPEIYPENQKEQEDISCSDISRSHIFHIVYSIENLVDLDGWHNEGYKFEKAYTAYAEGSRANSVITRYVQYIKAIEALFQGTSNKNVLKDKVSEITKKKNPKFDADFFYKLKDIRDRCEHTHPHGDNRTHISTSDIKRLKEVEQNLPDLTRIVKILFDHFKYI